MLHADEYFCQRCACDVEREELDQENAPGMDGVERRDDDGRRDAEGRQLFATVCADRKSGNASQRPQAHPLPQDTQHSLDPLSPFQQSLPGLRLMILRMFQS